MSKTAKAGEKIEAIEIKSYKDDKAVKAAIDGIKTSATNARHNAHSVACWMLGRVGETGDVRIIAPLLEKLEQAMGPAMRVNSLKKWFETFGPITFKGGKIAYTKDKPLKLQEAISEPFWKLDPEKEYKSIDMATFASAMIKKLEKDQIETGRDHSEWIAAIRGANAAIASKAAAKPQDGQEQAGAAKQPAIADMPPGALPSPSQDLSEALH